MRASYEQKKQKNYINGSFQLQLENYLEYIFKIPFFNRK